MALPAAAALSACRQQEAGYSGYAFIANQEGGAIAAVDMGVLAVVKHITVDGAPSQVLSVTAQSVVYALTPDTSQLHEIDTNTLKAARSLHLPAPPDTMFLAPDESAVYVLSRAAKALYAVDPKQMRVVWKLQFAETPVDFTVSPDGMTAAVTSNTTVRLVSLAVRSIGTPLANGNFGQARFLSNGERLIVADPDHQQLAIFRTNNPQLLVNLPLGVRPDNLCFNSDGGQLFVTGAGTDAAAIVYPYDIPEVAETVVVGHAPEAMTASRNLIFITSPSSGDVSVVSVGTHKVIAVVPVGRGPGAVAITPDDRLALILNRDSGDVAVLDISALQPNRYKSAAVVTVIPVGSRPVSAALHS